MKGRAVVREARRGRLRQPVRRRSPSIGAAAYVVGPLTFLLGNDYEKVDIEGARPRRSTPPRSRAPRRSSASGSTTAACGRPHRAAEGPAPHYRGDDVMRTVPIEIPANATRHAVDDGRRRHAPGAVGTARGAPAAAAQRRTQMIRALNKARKNNRLYVKLLGADAGAVVKRRVALVAAAVGAGRARRRIATAAASTRCTARTLGEWDLADRPRGQRRPHARRYARRQLRQGRRDGPALPLTSPLMPIRVDAARLAAVCRLVAVSAAAHAAVADVLAGRRRRPTSSRATSRTCRSTATAS